MQAQQVLNLCLKIHQILQLPSLNHLHLKSPIPFSSPDRSLLKLLSPSTCIESVLAWHCEIFKEDLNVRSRTLREIMFFVAFSPSRREPRAFSTPQTTFRLQDFTSLNQKYLQLLTKPYFSQSIYPGKLTC